MDVLMPSKGPEIVLRVWPCEGWEYINNSETWPWNLMIA
jgi:hypothetical protein